jgi:hypothetical protein
VEGRRLTVNQDYIEAVLRAGGIPVHPVEIVPGT